MRILRDSQTAGAMPDAAEVVNGARCGTEPATLNRPHLPMAPSRRTLRDVPHVCVIVMESTGCKQRG